MIAHLLFLPKSKPLKVWLLLRQIQMLVPSLSAMKKRSARTCRHNLGFCYHRRCCQLHEVRGKRIYFYMQLTNNPLYYKIV
jgi:hypothetical protein